MEPERQLSWEARLGRLAAAAAFGSAVLYLVSLALEGSVRSGVDSDREWLMEVHEDGALLLASVAVQAVSVALLAFVFFYLTRAAMARRPEVPSWILPLFFLAPLLLAVGGVIDRLELTDIADDFADRFAASEKPTDRAAERLAEDMLEDGGPAGRAIASGGAICLVLSFVLVSLNAMRAGLLSRFMGTLGIVVGFLTILPIVPIQAFWVFALGLLFLDRWPGGRGPAWERVEAIPWPSAAQARDAALLEDRAAEAVEEVESEAEEEPRPARRKRKKRGGR